MKERKEKAVIGHSTLMKIKMETKDSGRNIVKIAQIISDDCGDEIKIEEYFKETIIYENQKVKTFFDHKIDNRHQSDIGSPVLDLSSASIAKTLLTIFLRSDIPP